MSSPDGTVHIPFPSLPQPPIFDAPSNPYFGSEGSMANVLAGLTNMKSDSLGIRNATNEHSAKKLAVQARMFQSAIAMAKAKSTEIQMIVLSGYGLVLFFNLALLIHIRRNRHLVLQGNPCAARKTILPAFGPLVWIMSGVAATYLVGFGSLMYVDLFTTHSTLVTVEGMYACKQFLFLLVPVFLLQSSVSLWSLRRSLPLSAALSVYTVPLVWVMERYGDDEKQWLYYWLLFVARGMILVPCLAIFFCPPARASPQTVREYCGFLLLVFVSAFIPSELLRRGNVPAATTVAWVSVAWTGTNPFFIWRLLVADTEHWRGVGKRAVELQTLFRRNGVIDERVSSRGFHLLIEMHRKFVIDFAHLSVGSPIAHGTRSSVFAGAWLRKKQTPVAIKMYTPSVLDENTVAEFSHEAALCGALRHPSVLRFHGMCVCPPAICLVTELCRGSLLDITRQINHSRHSHESTRRQFLINLGYMLDAARAVAYLHSFKPPFLHCDIHPSSFLVDEQGAVKLSNFGASRTLNKGAHQGFGGIHHDDRSFHYEEEPAGSLDYKRRARTISGESPRFMTTSSWWSKKETAQSVHTDYIAPEVMCGSSVICVDGHLSQYGEAADIFALAVTMWDIVYPAAVKYEINDGSMAASTATTLSWSPQSNQSMRGEISSKSNDGTHQGGDWNTLAKLVVQGQRPYMDTHLYGPLRELIENAWHSDPRLRPSAQTIVGVLESIQEDAAALFAVELRCELRGTATSVAYAFDTLQPEFGHKENKNSRRHRQRRRDLPVKTQFTGTRLIEYMCAREYVSSRSEAIRLGNLLMDAGFVHHIKHSRSMEASSTLYFFDENHMDSSQPLAILEEDVHRSRREGAATGDEYSEAQRQSVNAKAASHCQRRSVKPRSNAKEQWRHASVTLIAPRESNIRESSPHNSRDLSGTPEPAMICSCRKLGQRLESGQSIRRCRPRRFRAPMDDATELTTNLLVADADFMALSEEDAANARDSDIVARMA